MGSVLAREPMRSQRIFALAVVVFVVCRAARADVITIYASSDTTIFQDAPANSDGGGGALFVGETERSSARRALISFDIADNIPAGATITSVQLSLFQEQASRSATTATPIGLYRLLDDWGEGTAGQGMPAARSGQGFPTPANGTAATWSSRFYNTVPWTNPGGDFVSTASGSTMVGINRGAYVWDSTPAMVADVQGWLDDPARNFGWLLMGLESTPGTARRFDSREAALSSVWPELTITFSGGAVPEPRTLASLALGILGVAIYFGRRRHRRAAE
jgi:PEP-CTERM motif